MGSARVVRTRPSADIAYRWEQQMPSQVCHKSHNCEQGPQVQVVLPHKRCMVALAVAAHNSA